MNKQIQVMITMLTSYDLGIAQLSFGLESLGTHPNTMCLASKTPLLQASGSLALPEVRCWTARSTGAILRLVLFNEGGVKWTWRCLNGTVIMLLLLERCFLCTCPGVLAHSESIRKALQVATHAHQHCQVFFHSLCSIPSPNSIIMHLTSWTLVVTRSY